MDWLHKYHMDKSQKLDVGKKVSEKYVHYLYTCLNTRNIYVV